MMVFGKQNSTESLEKLNSLTARSMAATVMERRNDETPSSQENVSLPNSKLSPLQPDNAAINLVSRYETPTGNQILSLNRIQTIVRIFLLFCSNHHHHFLSLIENN